LYITSIKFGKQNGPWHELVFTWTYPLYMQAKSFFENCSIVQKLSQQVGGFDG
jgi:hypothetical protein